MAIATVLQNFDIQKKKDSEGHEIPIPEGHTDGFVMYVVYLPLKFNSNLLLMHQPSHPVPLECSITPRSVEARNIILEAFGVA